MNDPSIGRSEIRNLIAPSGVYLAAHVAYLAASFISLPLLTRALSRDDYGLLSLVFALAGVLTLLGRLGFPQATLRFHSERVLQGGAAAGSRLSDSMLGASLLSGLLVGAAVLAAAAWFEAAGAPSRALGLRLAALVAAIRIPTGVICDLYRATERPVALSATRLATRYATIGMFLFFLTRGELDALAVIVATVVVELAVLSLCTFELRRRGTIRVPLPSRHFVAGAMSFGLPLAVAGAIKSLLDYSDRFLIGHFFDLGAVATYVVPYDFSSRLAEMLCEPVRMAAVPVAYRLWSMGGRETTGRFASQVLTYLVALAIPVGALFVALDRPLIELVASERYGSSASLTPYLVPGIFLGEMNVIASLGLAVQGRTRVIARNAALALALNVALNLVLLPAWGLVGAAVATTVAALVQAGFTYRDSHRLLDLRIDPRVVGTALLATAAMLLVVLVLMPTSPTLVLDLALRGGAGAATAALCFYVLDANLRSPTEAS
jgi:O-antigen/teichoic acid export membrane protein